MLLKRSNKIDEPVTVFEFLIDHEEDQWQLPSAKRLAQLYLKTKRFDDCISICLKFLQFDLNESDIQELLNMMGRSYRETGKHHSAALCFAGIVPRSATVDNLIQSELVLGESSHEALPTRLDEIEKNVIIDCLNRHGWNKASAAEELGVTARTLSNKLKLYQQQHPQQTFCDSSGRARAVRSFR